MTPAEYVRTGSAKIQGWLHPHAAAVIVDLGEHQAARGAVGEIGVHHGKLFLLLNLLRRSGEGAVALDLFDKQELNVDGSGLGDRGIFERNLARITPDRPVEIHAVDSTTVSAEEVEGWGGGGFRLFSVDGGHTAFITESDLSLAGRVLVPGGIIILDDYWNRAWPGVSEGANRFLSRQQEVVAFGSAPNKTFFTQAEFAETYRARLRAFGAEQRWSVVEQQFFDRPFVIVTGTSRREQWRTTAISNARRIGALRALEARVRKSDASSS